MFSPRDRGLIVQFQCRPCGMFFCFLFNFIRRKTCFFFFCIIYSVQFVSLFFSCFFSIHVFFLSFFLCPPNIGYIRSTRVRQYEYTFLRSILTEICASSLSREKCAFHFPTRRFFFLPRTARFEIVKTLRFISSALR